MNRLTILQGDWVEQLRTMPDGCVHCCVTSPPYWGLRDYGVPGQLGLERTPEEYVAKMVEGFREVRRVLRDDGTCWVNLGDSYAGGGRNSGNELSNTSEKQLSQIHSMSCGKGAVPHGCKPKDLIGIPWMVAFALRADGWYLRSDIIWHKPNPMPESVTDRPTKSHEYIFILTKRERYYYDAEAVKDRAQTEPHNSGYVNGAAYAVGPMDRGGHSQREDPDRIWASDGRRNKRTVWTVPSQAFNGAVSYGKCRIASPDCSVHDYHSDRARALEYGEQLISSLSDRNHDTFSRPFESQEGAFVSIPLDPCGILFDETSAIFRNNETRKTEGELVPSEIFFGISHNHIDCISQVRRLVSKFFRKHANKTLEDALEDASCSCPSEQNGRHIFGILTFQKIPDSCSCHYAGTVEKRQDHFACFPEDLIKPCILAGTSARGCCPKCGAPWERVVERGENTGTDGKQDNSETTLRNDALRHSGRVGETTTKTLGWQPTCECGEPNASPCTVLDPFGGSGTTAQVALELGRKAVIIELNPKYIPLIENRTNITPGLALA